MRLWINIGNSWKVLYGGVFFGIPAMHLHSDGGDGGVYYV